MLAIPKAPSVRRALLARTPGEAFKLLQQLLNARWQLRRCTSVGRLPRVSGRLHVYNNRGEMVIGDRVRIWSGYVRSVLAVFPSGRLEVGDRTVLNYGVDIAATRLVKIGADCMLGTHVAILDNDFHDLSNRDRRPDGRPVVIGDRVWLGNRVMILPGVTIGEGAAVGAGSVVMTDVPAGCLAMGNPARVIKSLRPDSPPTP